MAPASALGNQYDQNLRRRHSGGTLQRAQPAPGARHIGHEMEIDTAKPNEQSSGSKGKSTKPKRDMNIDPALAGTSGGSSSAASDGTATPVGSSGEFYTDRDANAAILGSLHELVKGLLARGQYVEDGEMTTGPGMANAEEAGDVEMGSPSKSVEESLYPKLNA